MDRQDKGLGLSGAPPERLTDEEQGWAIQVGRRLKAELATLVGALPAHDRTGPGLERVLGMNRAVAYRLMSAIAADDDLDVLMRVPGVEALRMFAISARKKLGPAVEPAIAGAESAIDDFRNLIRTSGGSHARLVNRIRSSREGLTNRKVSAPPGRREDVRQAMWEAVKVLSGRSIESRMSVSIVRPRIGDPGNHEYLHARAYIGYRAAAGGMPLVLSSWVTRPNDPGMTIPGMDYQSLDGALIEGRDVTGVLEEFCSSPLPLVTARDTTGRLVQVLDQSRAEPNESMDAVIAYHLPNLGQVPSKDDLPVYLEAANLTVPAKRMVYDLYVHRSMLVGATPSLNLYLGRGTGGCDLIDRWHEQIDGAPVLGLLGPGIRNAHSPAWERHAELTRYVFGKMGWDPGEFVGFRCDESWPLWNCDYVMALDYRPVPESGAPTGE